MRKPIIAGNWKMNLLPGQAVELVAGLMESLAGQEEVEVVVCPPFIDIPAVSRAISEGGGGVAIGAQNMHWEESGAFTGEISASMLLDLDVTHVIIGHSERRQYFGETDQGVNRKVKVALSRGLTPIMCVGESLKQREAGETENVIENQVRRGFFEIEEAGAAKVVVAYEPVWAIGTGKAATAADADEVTGFIRRTVASLYGAGVSEAVRIQYGGSVTPANVAELMSMPNIDGALVGGASLKVDDFSKLVRFT